MVLSCVVNRECTTPPSCLEMLTPSVYTAGGELGIWWEKLEFGWHCFSTQETPVTSVPLHGLEWGEKLNLVAIQSKTVMETEKFSLQLSVWRNWFILRIRARKRTVFFGKLYLCWPWSIRCLPLLKAQGHWGLCVALLLNGDSKDEWPAWCFCRDTLSLTMSVLL